MNKGYFAIILMLIIATTVFPLSSLGEKCQFSRECKEGYCIDGICKIPAVLENYQSFGECNSTNDCSNGFCYQRECVLPKRDPAVMPLGEGFKNSCAGIIENCTGFLCIFCNATWIILLLAAGFSSFLTRKRGRLTPIILFGIPVIAGLIFFPFIGAMIAIFQLILIAFVRPTAIAATIEEIKSIFAKKQSEEKKEEGNKNEQ
ncbi:MAG: hypothetical protein NZ903_00965 [Candidatus Micrarchaeota archaeon]|nr:hypothetical protein [Candidatus Micrarchaeota archaeon]